MIESELLLLGLLRESPKHGYEIKIKIKEILSLFTGVNLKSIYYPLRVLEKKGLIAKHITKEGKRPERYVYKLTPKGRIRFYGLLNKSLLDFKRPKFSLDLSLYFLHYLNPSVAKRRLRARMFILEKLTKGLRQMINASNENKRDHCLKNILEHNLQMVVTESKFLHNLIQTF